jgi:hypothetical protein
VSDTSQDIVYREIVGPSGAVYPIEPFRFVVGKTLVEMVDTYLSLNHMMKRNPQDADVLLDMRLEYMREEAESSALPQQVITS